MTSYLEPSYLEPSYLDPYYQREIFTGSYGYPNISGEIHGIHEYPYFSSGTGNVETISKRNRVIRYISPDSVFEFEDSSAFHPDFHPDTMTNEPLVVYSPNNYKGKDEGSDDDSGDIPGDLPSKLVREFQKVERRFEEEGIVMEPYIMPDEDEEDDDEDDALLDEYLKRRSATAHDTSSKEKTTKLLQRSATLRDTSSKEKKTFRDGWDKKTSIVGGTKSAGSWLLFLLGWTKKERKQIF